MKAVVLAGGLGTRLHPFTMVFPKPLMPIDGHPILELLLRHLKRHGFREIVILVGYLAPMIETFFGSGERLDLQLTYVREEQPLGTAGPLAFVDGLDQTFLVVNGDLLTTLDITAMISQHRTSASIATIGARRRDVYIDYGVLDITAADTLKEFTEKPTLHYWVSMGVNLFEPEALALIPKGDRYDIPSLLEALRAIGKRVGCFRSDDYWLDIGRPEDYARAQEEFADIRANFGV